MVKIDFETIILFGCHVNDEKALACYGDKEFTWEIIYSKDLSTVKTYDFYKILNPHKSILIENVYIFNHLTDAFIFYSKKSLDFFKNSILIITDSNANHFVEEYLLKIASKHKKKIRLNFFHRKNKFDLISLYINLLDRNINFFIKDESSIIEINFKQVSANLNFREALNVRKFLEINDREFYIKNTVLKDEQINTRLNW